MKIIEALKKIKHLDRKIEKNTKRINEWCSYLKDKDLTEEEEAPLYNEEEIRKMIQQVDDWVTEKTRLRHVLHKTNLSTTVDLGDGTQYTIDQLLGIKEITLPQQISIRKYLRRKEKGGWGDDKGKVVVNQFDPKERDKEIDKLENHHQELSDLLDRLTLETDVIE